MRIKIALIISLFFIVFYAYSQSSYVTDIDGNKYNQVQIGDQLWLKENLKTTRYRNGDLISTTSSPDSILPGETQPKYQWAYNGNESYVGTFGRLYTWYAAMDLRGICPVGFHVPTDKEWTTLTDYLGGIMVAGGKLKEAGFAHWNIPNTGATNESGFSALPGTNMGLYGYYWSSSQDGHDNGWTRIFYYNYTELSKNPYAKSNGYSVRCIKDKQILSVFTNSVSAISSTSARVGSNLNSEGGTNVEARGICWAFDHNPATSDFHTNDDKVIGPITSNLEELIPNTLYYARAYATNSSGTIYGEEVSFRTTTQLNDIDGSTYNTVKIGNQLWMKENLRTKLYRNGDTIPTTSIDTLDLTEIEINEENPHKYCWAYNSDESNVSIYGRLYTNYAAYDPRSICPNGWHLPSADDWALLSDYLGGEHIAGGKLKAAGTDNWLFPNTGATDIVGFKAIPGGVRRNKGTFENIGVTGSWFCTDDNPNLNVSWLVSMSFDEQKITKPNYGPYKDDGYSARCIKDDFRINIYDASANPQDSLEIWITLRELLPEENIFNYHFDIDYKESRFSFNGFLMDETASLNTTMDVDTSDLDRLRVYCKSDIPLQGKWLLIRLKFRTLDVAESQFKVSNVFFNDTISVGVSKDIIAYWDFTAPTGSVTYDHNDISIGDKLLITISFSEPMDNSRNILITLPSPWNLEPVAMTRVSPNIYTYLYQVPIVSGTARIELLDCADISGISIDKALQGGTFTVKNKLGDVNKDGNILPTDAVLALQYSVGLDPLPQEDPIPWESWRIEKSDVDGKAGNTSYDASLILQRSKNLIFAFPGETGIETASSEYDNVSVSEEYGNLVFRSKGYFFALDLSLSGPNQFLKPPKFIDRTILTAVNITDNIYAVGICTSVPLPENTVIMKIPYLPGSDSLLKFSLFVNGDPKRIAENFNAVNPTLIDFWTVWPNPADEVLNLKDIRFGSFYEILDAGGRIVMYGINTDNRIDISQLPGGFYLLRIKTPEKLISKRIIKLRH